MDAKWKNPDYLVRYLTRGYFTILFFMLMIAGYNMLYTDMPIMTFVNHDTVWICGLFTGIGAIMITPLFFNMPYDKIVFSDYYIMLKGIFRMFANVTLYTFALNMIIFDMAEYFDSNILYYSFVETVYMHYINLGSYIIYAYVIITFVIPAFAHILEPFNKRGEYGR